MYDRRKVINGTTKRDCERRNILAINVELMCPVSSKNIMIALAYYY